MITVSAIFPYHLHPHDLLTGDSLNLRLQSLGQEIQLEVAEEQGEMKIKLKGYGHKPICVNYQPSIVFEAVIPIQGPTHCEICGEENEYGLRCPDCIQED